MGGDISIWNFPVWGIKGIEASTNNPGAREGCFRWKDSVGNLMLFGGVNGYFSGGGTYSDMWKFDVTTKHWTWIDGNNTLNMPPIYGVRGLGSASNNIGARDGGGNWIDSSGHLWLFGGIFFSNDLWRYAPETPFPVHLLTFTAHLKDNKALLNWQVENEQNFDHYQIERSSNGKDFGNIGTIKAANKKEYDFTDKHPTSNEPTSNQKRETVFYRLKMIDKDGSFTYSNIAAVKLPFSNSFSIFPNPTHGTAQLVFGKNVQGKISITITDLSGRMVLQQSIDRATGNVTLNISKLPAGTYTVQVVSNGETATEKMVVE